MDNGKVQTIKYIRKQVADLVVAIEPINDAEWDAFEVLMNVHRSLRKVDLDKLTQLQMDITPEAEEVKQAVLSEAAAVVSGEDSLTDRQDIIPPPTIDPDNQPNLDNQPDTTIELNNFCNSCSKKDDCDWGSVYLENGKPVCPKRSADDKEPEHKKRGRKSKNQDAPEIE